MRLRPSWLFCGFSTLAIAACGDGPAATAEETSAPTEETAFAADQAFLRYYDRDLTVLEMGRARVIVSAKYQGKVLTSSATGAESFGYINREVFAEPEPLEHINGYGGENRLWLGPESAQYAIFFAEGTPYESESWYTPPAFDYEPWTQTERTPTLVSFTKEFELRNRVNTDFVGRVDRTVEMISPSRAASRWGVDLARVSLAAYSTRNTLTNTGPAAWTRSGGTLCLWALDMLPGSDSTAIVYPLADRSASRGAVTEYFGDLEDDQFWVADNAVVMRGSGSRLNKFGLSPKLATGVGGAIDYASQTLTLIDYDLDPDATYLGMEWRDLPDPYAGDVATSYNDPGPDTFYELESVGEAAFLGPGESTSHRHDVYHFTGPIGELERIAAFVWGIDMAPVRQFAVGTEVVD